MVRAALERHPAVPCAALRGIEASVSRGGKGTLDVVYRIAGALERLRIPAPCAPRAAERLWRHTCCEIFVAHALPAYREFNFSPSGEWAAYAFSSYRAGGALAAADPGIAMKRSPGLLELSASVGDIPEGRLRIGLCAVIEDGAGALSYWALAHAGGKPDFHRPETFAVELDEVRH